jgi:hypothetical protein
MPLYTLIGSKKISRRMSTPVIRYWCFDLFAIFVIPEITPIISIYFYPWIDDVTVRYA